MKFHQKLGEYCNCRRKSKQSAQIEDHSPYGRQHKIIGISRIQAHQIYTTILTHAHKYADKLVSQHVQQCTILRLEKAQDK